LHHEFIFSIIDSSLLNFKADKSSYMIGSRAPKGELQEYLSGKEVAPSGMMARGKYHMKSHIIDDDKNTYAEWEWTLEISKEWK
jgi:Rho GDP-dissociation inhibitor